MADYNETPDLSAQMIENCENIDMLEAENVAIRIENAKLLIRVDYWQQLDKHRRMRSDNSRQMDKPSRVHSDDS
ncbi:hypothetical protein PanWU01x14_321150 [Parasponia andersonii]|uniref:Uncharacterized protein n=1 Tax=Parasponia andersonii TaxID=3476 RepID=A0A2P5AL68_PARAD|nr:hypothetical protein PanWU01x14_321150 [Parasponia andersonii]